MFPILKILKKNTPFLLVYPILLTVLLSLPIFPLPLARDQGIFAYVAEGILKGLAPYRYSFDIKPPSIFFIYAFSFYLFGISAKSIYLMDIIYRLVTLCAIYLTARKMYGGKAAICSSVLYGVFSSLVFNRIWRCAQTETFMVLPLVLAFYFYLLSAEQEEGRWAVVLCGLFSGFVFMIKYSAAVAIILFPLIWLYKAKKNNIYYFSLGFFLSILPFVCYFLYHKSLYELYLSTIEFNIFHLKRSLALSGIYKAFVRYGKKILMELHFLLLLSASFIFLKKKHEDSKYYYLLILFLFFSFFSVVVQGKFWLYHWIILLAPLSLMAGLPLAWLYDGFKPKSTLTKNVCFFAFSLSILLFTMKTSHFAYRVKENIRYLSGNMTREEFLLPFDNLTSNVSFSNDEAMASYIKSNTSEDETVWIFGHESIVYFLARRRSPTRFQWDYPLTIDTPGTNGIKNRFIKTCLDELNSKKPKIIFIMLKDANPIERYNSVIQWNRIPDFVKFLENNYTFTEEKYNSMVYWRGK